MRNKKDIVTSLYISLMLVVLLLYETSIFFVAYDGVSSASIPLIYNETTYHIIIWVNVLFKILIFMLILKFKHNIIAYIVILVLLPIIININYYSDNDNSNKSKLVVFFSVFYNFF